VVWWGLDKIIVKYNAADTALGSPAASGAASQLDGPAAIASSAAPKAGTVLNGQAAIASSAAPKAGKKKTVFFMSVRERMELHWYTH